MPLASRTADAPARPGRGGGRRRAGGPQTDRRRRRRRVLRWSATVLAVVILGTAGAGYLYYQHLNSNIRKGERAGGDDSKAQRTAPNAAGQTPLNILLIGSDSRNSKENLKLGGSRDHVGDPPLADVQMLIHLSADRKSAAMVSIPRDTRVHIPECKDPDGKDYPPTDDIINVTLARGGAGCTLLTWEELTGVYIDHWMTIDFAGVVRMADAIGGVEVCVNQNVWDHSTPSQRGGSGLKLTKGSHKVKGEQALQWLRTRHAWGSDLMRARAQHMYLNSMIRTLKKQNVFTDTGRLMDLAEAATKSLQVSEEIGTVKKLYDLGMEMKSVPTDRITSVTMPNVPDPNDPDNHVVPDRSKADKVWQMLKDDVPFDKNGGKSGGKKDGAKKDGGKDGSARTPSLDAARLGVLVQNATRTSAEAAVPQRASAIGQVLVRKGYARAQADTSGSLAEDRTVVRYPSADLEGDAQAVAEALGIPMSQVQKSTEVSGVTVVVGADWRTGTAYPKESVPKAGDLPEGTDAANASDKPTCMDVYKPYQWR
ncbi:LCP family protein [Streptomyces capoamus]|uniref:LCP family protein n=1 Tax=Streptomyces capoamus TaxID=68183 RepID=UPI0016793238|nr:LCP family protein [Streptomyces capoamus]